jgi:hypothetical protein
MTADDCLPTAFCPERAYGRLSRVHGSLYSSFDSQRAQPVYGSQYMMRPRMSSIIGTKVAWRLLF